ncbi:MULTISPECIES: bacteriophage spanin2 family protein [unclassified Crossiella]|uniref:bacteriophage spanin2 family protein n=1 Tax=unclassified Crossiella TaxID=2620835 RepID=UPI001FFFEA42|nr:MULTISPECIES: bacteriophage spanin2 family protein [unclassified Crossiella]MCK2237457.1 bacteriophage spanin2 family protein [Crossiella sp. S99.2]MCK2251112.1 bacteriophage spanin2 family protein [Crossiella sp. S99.1]
MRAARPVATVLLTLGLFGGLAGCGALQQATDTANKVGDVANKATLCIDALKLAGFTPNAADPQKALEETQKKAKELEALAAKAGDATVKTAIDDMAKSMSSVTLKDFGPEALATWLKNKTDQLTKLSTACGS